MTKKNRNMETLKGPDCKRKCEYFILIQKYSQIIKVTVSFTILYGRKGKK